MCQQFIHCRKAISWSGVLLSFNKLETQFVFLEEIGCKIDKKVWFDL